MATMLSKHFCASLRLLRTQRSQTVREASISRDSLSLSLTHASKIVLRSVRTSTVAAWCSAALRKGERDRSWLSPTWSSTIYTASSRTPSAITSYRTCWNLTIRAATTRSSEWSPPTSSASANSSSPRMSSKSASRARWRGHILTWYSVEHSSRMMPL